MQTKIVVPNYISVIALEANNTTAIITDLIRDVLVGWWFKGVPLLYLTIWLHRLVCIADIGSLPQSVRQ